MSSRGPFIVRRARAEDIDTLVQYSAAMAEETEGRVLDRDLLHRGTLAVLQSSEKGFYLVAEGPRYAEWPIIGQLMVTYEWSDWRNAAFWWIQSVYVHPSWRRRGVYRSLHESVVKQARDRGDVCGIRLYVEEQNSLAQAAYTHVGLSQANYRMFEEDFVLPKRIATPSE